MQIAGFSLKSIAMIAIIAISSIALSAFAYEYYISTSDKIISIAKDEIRSNSRIASYDLSNSLKNKLDGISSNLAMLSESTSVQDGETERVKTLLTAAQNSTGDFTDFYKWADQDGKIKVSIDSTEKNPEQPVFIGRNILLKPWFQNPKSNLRPYAVSTAISLDGRPRLFISYPVVITEDSTTSAIDKHRFNGIVYAGIAPEKMGKYLESHLSPDIAAFVTLSDMNGNILYSPDKSIVGYNVLSTYFRDEYIASVVGAGAPLDLFDGMMKQSLRGGSGVADISLLNTTYTISYDPIMVGDQFFGTVYIIKPQSFAGKVVSLLDEQRTIAMIIIAVIGSIAAGISVAILSWTKKLTLLVEERTDELGKRSMELEMANKELRIANDELKNLDKMKTEFVNIAAHELRNPLQPIITYSELARDGIIDKKEALDVIDEQAQRLQHLASDVLTVSRIESGSLTMNMQKFSLKDFLDGIVLTARTWIPRDKASSLSIRLDFDDNVDDIMLKGDVTRLSQVLANLLGNALKFTPDGEIVVSARAYKDESSIERRSSDKEGDANNGDLMQIKIIDTGKGIPEDMFPRLFGKFATNDLGNENSQGAGLGLYISKKIVEAHGGQIWAENNGEGMSGATFSFTLPIPRT